MADFSVIGPIEIPFTKVKNGKHLEFPEFWENNPELKKKCGVYVFAIRAGKGITPHYVGSTTKTFEQECFNPTNKTKIHNVMIKYISGNPVMFFIIHPLQKGKKNSREIDDLETYFIQLSVVKNPDVQNSRKIHRPKWKINGINGGKASKSTKQLKLAVGL